VTEFNVSAPAISQHLKILRAARLVRARVEGQRRIQALDWRGLREIETWLARTKRFWERRLDALERELRAEDGRDRNKRTSRVAEHKAGGDD
jgi:DNA-binding transcriptional ArsR family regulator